jgi:GNAT superfamily N-acetyltransferase
MFVLPDNIAILNVQRNSLVRAKLVPLTRELAATEIDGAWWKIPVSKKLRESEGDHHWVWRKLVGLYRNRLAWDIVAVQSASGAVEGAMLYRIDARSQIQTGEGAVYVDRLATAPRNRPWLGDPPKYRGIGKVLLLAAVRHSYLLGLGGRVWLTSLPTEKTRRFYENRGFQVIFENEDGTIDYELPAEVSRQWLKSEGYL